MAVRVAVRVAQRVRTGPSLVALLFCALLLLAAPATRAAARATADGHPVGHIAAGYVVAVPAQPLSTRTSVRLQGDTPADLGSADSTTLPEQFVAVPVVHQSAQASDHASRVRSRAPPSLLTA